MMSKLTASALRGQVEELRVQQFRHGLSCARQRRPLPSFARCVSQSLHTSARLCRSAVATQTESAQEAGRPGTDVAWSKSKAIESRLSTQQKQMVPARSLRTGHVPPPSRRGGATRMPRLYSTSKPAWAEAAEVQGPPPGLCRGGGNSPPSLDGRVRGGLQEEGQHALGFHEQARPYDPPGIEPGRGAFGLRRFGVPRWGEGRARRQAEGGVGSLAPFDDATQKAHASAFRPAHEGVAEQRRLLAELATPKE